MLATFMRHLRNNNLEIGIASSSCHPQLRKKGHASMNMWVVTKGWRPKSTLSKSNIPGYVFPSSRYFSMRKHVNFTPETMFGRSRVSVKVEPRSTFTCALSYVASISFTRRFYMHSNERKNSATVRSCLVSRRLLTGIAFTRQLKILVTALNVTSFERRKLSYSKKYITSSPNRKTVRTKYFSYRS